MFQLISWFVAAAIVLNIAAGVIVNNERTEIYLISGEGFQEYFINFEKIQKCNLELKDFIYNLNPNAYIPQVYRTEDHEIIQRYSTQYCGVRITNVTTASSYLLWVEDVEGNRQNATISVNLIATRSDPIRRTITAHIGEHVPVDCTTHVSKQACRLIEADGNVHPVCSHLVKVKKSTTLTCKMLIWGRMEEFTEFIDIIVEPEPKATTRAKIIETDSSFILRCETDEAVVRCHANNTNGQSGNILIMGAFMSKDNVYSTYDTNLDAGVCSLEISKPLTAENSGLWRIYQHYSNDMSGCLFTLTPNETTRLVENSLVISNENEPQLIEILQSDELNIRCEAPHPLTHCYVRSPNMTLHFMDNFAFERSKYLGYCEVKNLPKINGKWICGINGDWQNITEDIQRYYEVRIFDHKMGHVPVDEIETSRNSQIDLTCTAAFSDPIQNCFFITPEGRVLTISEEFDVGNRFSYFGGGFVNGDCGLRIVKVLGEDFGKWVCNFQTSDGRTTANFSFDINVREKDSNVQTILVSVLVPVAVIAMLIFGYLIYRYNVKLRQVAEDLIGLTKRE